LECWLRREEQNKDVRRSFEAGRAKRAQERDAKQKPGRGNPNKAEKCTQETEGKTREKGKSETAAGEKIGSPLSQRKPLVRPS